MRARTLSFIGAIGVLLLASAGPADAAFAPDPTFDDDGAVVLVDGASSDGLAVASANGKTYVAYRDMEGNLNVARLTLEGDADATWGGGDGLVETSLKAYGGADLLVLANGKVLVAGGGNASGLGLGVVRLTPTGVPDTTFSGDGKAVKASANLEGGEHLAVDANGRIYVAGQRTQIIGPGDSKSDFAVARFTANGGLDNTFSGDAIAFVNQRTLDDLADVAIDRGGRVLLMGDSRAAQFDLQNGIGLVARLRANGTPDPAFSGDGKMTFTFGGPPTTTVLGLGGGVDASNRVVFGVATMNDKVGAVRLTAGGALDTTYSGDGRAVAPFTSFLSRDGADRVGTSIVFTGWGGDGELWAGRLTATGAPDTAFGINGELLFDASSYDNDHARSAAAGPSGSIVTTGYAATAGSNVLVTRLNAAP